jgi:hypothetical protein
MDQFDTFGEVGVLPRYNIAPTQPVVTIRQDTREPVRELSAMMGATAFMGQGYKHGVQNHQRQGGNSHHDSLFPGTVQVPAVPVILHMVDSRAHGIASHESRVEGSRKAWSLGFVVAVPLLAYLVGLWVGRKFRANPGRQ